MRIKTDFHMHSNNSDDSTAAIEEMCRSAVSKGLEKICFTEHVSWNKLDTGYKYFNYEKYSDDIERARDTFAGQLEIYKGIEFDAPFTYKKEFEYEKNKKYDIILASVHFIGEYFIGDTALLSAYTKEQIVEMYCKDIFNNISYGGFDVLAHMDFPKRYFEFDFEANQMVDEILKTMIKNSIALEINSSSLRKGINEPMPSFSIFDRYYRHGGRLISIGSDAHRPEDIAEPFKKIDTKIAEYGDLKYIKI